MKVLLIDDHQMLLNGLVKLLSDHFSALTFTTADSGKKALEQLKENTFDLILLDINLPDIDGISLCKTIKKKHPEQKIIVLTTHQEATIIQKMINAGANGYVLKTVHEQELIHAIEEVLKNGKYFSLEVTNTLLGITRVSTNRSYISPVLTRREKEVLHLILQEFTTQEIAGKLFISETTVTTHRQNLLSKFNARNTAGLVKRALESGFSSD